MRDETERVEAFISYWQGREGGQERANCAHSFRRMLERCEIEVGTFQPMVGQLWEVMDKGEFAYAIEQKVRRFNGVFFTPASSP